MPTKIVQIKSIKWRWEEAKKGLPADMPEAEQMRLMLTFYAGFAACLEFTMELAEMDEMSAVNFLRMVGEECDIIGSAAMKAFGPKPS